jgi:hypothetical protein
VVLVEVAEEGAVGTKKLRGRRGTAMAAGVAATTITSTSRIVTTTMEKKPLHPETTIK